MVNWCNLESVIQFAKKLGSGQTVYKHPDRNNYNIRHTEREGELPKECVIHYRT